MDFNLAFDIICKFIGVLCIIMFSCRLLELIFKPVWNQFLSIDTTILHKRYKGRSGKRIALAIFRSLNCEYSTEKTDNDQYSHTVFRYQGGTFDLSIAEGSHFGTITYYNFYKAPTDEIHNIRGLCNHYNDICNCNLYYTPQEDENIVTVHLSFEILLQDHIAGLKDIFMKKIDSCFKITNDFRNTMDEVKSEQNKDIEHEKINHLREIALLREQEIISDTNKSPFVENIDTDNINLISFISRLFSITVVKIRSITIANASQVTKLTHETDFINFDIFPLIINTDNGITNATFKDDTTILVLFSDGLSEESTNQRLLIHLNADTETEFELYFRLTYCSIASETSESASLSNPNRLSQSMTLLMSFDKKSDNQKRAEVEYMLHDAKDKVAADKHEELTEEQNMLLNIEIPQIAYSLYWGKKHYLNKCYYEAIPHLENAFNYIYQNHTEIDTDDISDFGEICYLTGCSYTHIGDYKSAYFYLDIVSQDKKISHGIAFLNCLHYMHDWRAIQYIDQLLESLPPYSDDLTDEYFNMVRHIYQIKVKELIYNKLFDNAAAMLESMKNDEMQQNFIAEQRAILDKLNNNEEKSGKVANDATQTNK